jgi:hypothetical protein
MTQIANPLRHFFRQPAIYLQLPSGGEHWPPGAIDMPPNKELPVLPMTAIDEITYRTPDALFNGQAVVSVIQSCVPHIKDAWKIPTTDINAILVAIRIASYGNELEISSTCPKCNELGDYNLDLRNVLDQIKTPDYQKSINHSDLEIFFRPIDYSEQHTANHEQWQEQRLIQMIPGSDLPDDEKIAKLNEALQKLTKLTINALKHSIACIKTPQALVTETEFISEFLNNCDRNLFNKIRDHVIVLREGTDFKPMHLTCHSCKHEYNQSLTLDMASFFEPAS